jgi:hypothetical protein
MSRRERTWDTLSIALALAAASVLVFVLQKRPAAGAPPRSAVPQVAPAKPEGGPVPVRPPLQWRLTVSC